MGCDIHTYKEKFIDGKWVTADEWEPYDYGEGAAGKSIPYNKQAYSDRNYNLFGLLAGVRNREGTLTLVPRGIPFDVSPEVQYANEKWDADGHSHSYLYLHELRSLRALVRERTIPVSGMKRQEEVAALESSIASGKPNYELLYPYCQWTTDKLQVEFRINLPMDFMVGRCLDKIIAAFDGIAAENHRLVFWFDN